MGNMRWCRYCKDYFPIQIFFRHKEQHEHEMNTDAVQHKQYAGIGETEKEDYFICVLHQRKTPCPIKDCECVPFGMIKKSYLLRCAKGIYDLSDTSKRCEPFFPEHDEETGRNMIPIDMETKTVIIKGVTIKLRL